MVYSRKPCLHFFNDSDPREKPQNPGSKLTSGSHQFSFQYSLATDLPSSFENQDEQFKGRVHYLLRAKLDTPDDSLRQHVDKVFIVLNTLDLNREPSALVGGIKTDKPGVSVVLKIKAELCPPNQWSPI